MISQVIKEVEEGEKCLFGGVSCQDVHVEASRSSFGTGSNPCPGISQ